MDPEPSTRIVFPLRTTADDVSYEEHNLWLVDDTLSFYEFVASDMPFGSNAETRIESPRRPDLLAFKTGDPPSQHAPPPRRHELTYHGALPPAASKREPAALGVVEGRQDYFLGAALPRGGELTTRKREFFWSKVRTDRLNSAAPMSGDPGIECTVTRTPENS